MAGHAKFSRTGKNHFLRNLIEADVHERHVEYEKLTDTIPQMSAPQNTMVSMHSPSHQLAQLTLTTTIRLTVRRSL